MLGIAFPGNAPSPHSPCPAQAEREARIAAELADADDSLRVQEEEAMSSTLGPLGLAIHEIAPDGHCLYRALGGWRHAGCWCLEALYQFSPACKLCARLVWPALLERPLIRSGPGMMERQAFYSFRSTPLGDGAPGNASLVQHPGAYSTLSSPPLPCRAPAGPPGREWRGILPGAAAPGC